MPISSNAHSIAGAAILVPDAVRQHRVGQRANGNEGGEFIYVRFTGTVAPGQVVGIDQNFDAALLSTAASPRGRPVGVARCTTTAANQFGWVQVRGQAPVNVLANCAANARLNTTATAGALDDDGTVGAKVVDGAVIVVANGGATAAVEAHLLDPVVGVTL